MGWSGPWRRMCLPHVRRKDATPGRDSLQRCELPTVQDEDAEGLKSEYPRHTALESERGLGRSMVWRSESRESIWSSRGVALGS